MTCVWDADTACVQEQWDALSLEVRERSLMLASSTLQNLTYGRVGSCPVTIRPCPEPVCGCVDLVDSAILGPGYGGSFAPHRGVDGLWYNVCDRHPCSPVSEIDLPGPVGYIESLRIDGNEQDLASGNWRLDDGHLLVWQGSGPSPVPSTQNLNLPDTEVGTWSVTYSRSYPVQADGRIAVAMLAMEFAKACQPKAKCALPRGVTSVVRNGVSFTVEAGLFPNGLTGIETVDIFILKWAPAGSPTRTAAVGDPRSLRNRPRRTNSVPMRVPTGSV